jgi:hypothetical protein
MGITLHHPRKMDAMFLHQERQMKYNFLAGLGQGCDDSLLQTYHNSEMIKVVTRL